jgi:hypothetical protein
MTAQTPKRFFVTVVEVLVRSTTVTAIDERDANELVREMWDETGPAKFHTHTLGSTELDNAEEVNS